jgi:hypothetical protein
MPIEPPLKPEHRRNSQAEVLSNLNPRVDSTSRTANILALENPVRRLALHT